ncbi:hypothetical protein [Halobacillus faecis]|uniref:Uncharacterized protein n=1 Tax=Halobacillus faecis TaxID=360184 RepID=A0A511WWA4_9BACI|nr:hypothetical protein [Halobacillus faecis]GEN54611.1 hypothetical protein HFA01_28730 [Halobacillus faecis]
MNYIKAINAFYDHQRVKHEKHGDSVSNGDKIPNNNGFKFPNLSMPAGVLIIHYLPIY